MQRRRFTDRMLVQQRVRPEGQGRNAGAGYELADLEKSGRQALNPVRREAQKTR
jgi:hypothetical protein